MRIRYLIYLSLTFLGTAYSQQPLNLHVSVIKDFEPTLADAYKINNLPAIIDTENVKVSFEYKLYPKQYPTNFYPTPLKPAKYTSESIATLYKNNLKLGGGIYSTLVATYAFNTTRNDNWSAGFYANHYSSRGKIKLKNNYKYDAFFSENNLEGYAKKFYKNYVIHTNAKFDRYVYNYYGHKIEFDSLFKMSKQIYSIGGIKAGYYTSHLDTTKIMHNADVMFNILNDKFSNFENNVYVTGSVSKIFNSQIFGGDISVNWYNINTSSDTNNKAIVSIFPWVRFFGEQWRLNCGFALEVDAYSDSTFYHYYPKANIQYNVIENFLIPFAGFNGKMIINTLTTLILHSPYIKPGLHFKNTNNLMHIYAGFKGNFSKNISYLLQGNYSLYENLPFFINDTLIPSKIIAQPGNFFDTIITPIIYNPENYFIVVYDGTKSKECQEVKFTGEIAFKHKEKLNIILSGNLLRYTLSNLDKPYQKPLWDVTLSSRYNIQQKFILTIDLLVIGDRWARTYNINKKTYENIKLSPFTDLNLKVDYYYSKLFGAFLKFNNILNKNYSYWNNYPVQKLQIIGGITMSF
ncbi:MAG: hypothetical protein N3A01_04990 [Bacteroidales bacterium]|nr:hypothetical protein [Bacteroidales bacterium]